MGFILARISLALTFVVALTTAFPDGAPDTACATLNPDTHGKSTALGPNPYVLELSSDTYTGDQRLTVTLKGALFKGFLIIGKKADNSSSESVGFFTSTPESDYVCDSAALGNGITQNSNSVKSSVSIPWNAPGTATGDIVFHFTVVRGGAPSTEIDPSDYYMDNISKTLRPVRQSLPEKKVSESVRFMSIRKESKAVSGLERLLRGQDLP